MNTYKLLYLLISGFVQTQILNRAFFFTSQRNFVYPIKKTNKQTNKQKFYVKAYQGTYSTKLVVRLLASVCLDHTHTCQQRRSQTLYTALLRYVIASSAIIEGSNWGSSGSGGPVKLDSMWQHRLTRPLHVQHTYYRIIFEQNPFNIISRGVQRWTSTDFRLK